MSLFAKITGGLRAICKNHIDLWFGGINAARRHVLFNASAFDAQHYLEHNPDVLSKGKEAFRHFTENGLQENRPARFFDSHWYLSRYPDLLFGRFDALTHYRLFGELEGRAARFISLNADVLRAGRSNYQEWVDLYDRLSRDDIAYLTGKSAELEAPSICALMVFDEGTPIEKVLKSLTTQIRQPNQITIVFPSRASLIGEQLQTVLPPSSGIVVRPYEDDIASALNRAVAETTCDYVLYVGGAGELHSAALYWIAESLARNDDIEILYGDEDLKDDKGVRQSPYFKCGFNYELMLSHNLFGPLAVYKRNLLEMIRGFEETPSPGYDLAWRAVENSVPDMIYHLPRVLFHKYAAATQSPSIEAVERHLLRENLAGTVTEAPNAPGFTRVRLELPTPLPLITIIVPTRDRVDLLRICISSVIAKTTYPNYEIIVVDNGSTEAQTHAYLEQIRGDARVKVLSDSRPFNFSALNNAAVSVARGEFVCLLNNDIEIVTEDWLEELLSFAQKDDVGCVGARLWYPDGTLQHGGVLVGFHGVAGHLHKHLPKGELGYCSRAVIHQSLSAVTAACLLVRKAIYQEAGGLDEAFAVAFNDVDFCLKVRDAGYRNVWTPYAEMIHHESASRGQNTSPEKRRREQNEIDLMKERWGEELMKDPAYSPNLSLTSEDLSFAWPPRIKTVAELRSTTQQ